MQQRSYVCISALTEGFQKENLFPTLQPFGGIKGELARRRRKVYFIEDANTEVTANDKLELFLKWIQACTNSEHNSKGTLVNLTIVAFVFKKFR